VTTTTRRSVAVVGLDQSEKGVFTPICDKQRYCFHYNVSYCFVRVLHLTGVTMRRSTRVILSGLIGLLAIAAVPVQSADATGKLPAMVGCCR
jgi:hypothetical protein